MKKKLLIVFFVVMGLLLASCGSAPQQPVNNNPAPTDVDETPETPVNPEEPANPQENPEDDPFGDVDMVDMGLYMPLITTEAESHYVGYMYDQIKVIKDLNFDVLATEFSVNLIELGGSDP